jgi:hypothetical protein
MSLEATRAIVEASTRFAKILQLIEAAIEPGEIAFGNLKRMSSCSRVYWLRGTLGWMGR